MRTSLGLLRLTLSLAATLGVIVASAPAASAVTGGSPQVLRFDSGGIDRASAIAVDPTGNVYLAGSSIVKLDPQGAVIWSKPVSADPVNSADAVTVDAAGNVYVAGQTTTETFHGTSDALVIKIGPNGVEQWRQRLDGGGSDALYRIAVDQAGNVYASGRTDGAGIDWLTVKVAANGTLQWTRRLSSSDAVEDFVADMMLAPDGDLVVAGTLNTGDTLTDDAVVVKYDPQGNTVWQRQFSATNISDEAVGDIDIDAAGRIAVSASSAPNASPEVGEPLRTPLSLRYDASGTLLQTISAGGHAVDVDAAGNAYLAGAFDVAGSSKVAKFDANGNQVWSTPLTAATNQFLSVVAVAVDTQGVLTLAGTVINKVNLGRDYLTIRYGADGRELWRHQFDATGNADDVAALAVDGQDAALVAGTSANDVGTSHTDMVTLRFPAGVTPSGNVPAAPAQLAASALSRTQIGLTWTDRSADETGFRIERCQGTGCANFAQIAVVAVNTTKFTDSGLARNTSYTYRVRAFNAAGDSPFSNTATAVTRRF